MVNKYLFFIVFATIFFMISLIIMFGNFWNSPPPYEDLISVEGRIFFLDAQTPKSGVPLMIYGHKGQIKLLCWDVEYSDATCFKKDKRNILRGKTALAKYYAAKKLAFIPENRLMELIVDGEILVNCQVPCDHIPRSSYSLFRARGVCKQLIATIRAKAAETN